MRYGYWLPVFGGWLRNVEDEQMEATWEYASRLARRSEEIGFDLTLIAELNLNDIKGADAPALDAWSTAAALAAVTNRLELMVAVRPTFHSPALLAKQAANIDHIAGPGRLSLNVVSSWWADEAKKYGVHFEQHDDRYARTEEWLEVVEQMWKRDHFCFSGSYYQVEDSILQPKPISQPRPLIYAGGESEAAKELISERCDAFVMHGDPPDRIRSKIADMSERREKKGLGPMTFGVAAYSIVRDTEDRKSTRLNSSHLGISYAVFCLNETVTSGIYTLSLHDALPISGGESEAAKELISERCDAFVMHGDPPDRIRSKIADMSERREKKGLGPMTFGVAAYSIVRDTEKEAQRELARITDVKQSAAGYDNYQQWL